MVREAWNYEDNNYSPYDALFECFKVGPCKANKQYNSKDECRTTIKTQKKNLMQKEERCAFFLSMLATFIIAILTYVRC